MSPIAMDGTDASKLRLGIFIVSVYDMGLFLFQLERYDSTGLLDKSRDVYPTFVRHVLARLQHHDLVLLPFLSGKQTRQARGEGLVGDRIAIQYDGRSSEFHFGVLALVLFVGFFFALGNFLRSALLGLNGGANKKKDNEDKSYVAGSACRGFHQQFVPPKLHSSLAFTAVLRRVGRLAFFDSSS